MARLRVANASKPTPATWVVCAQGVWMDEEEAKASGDLIKNENPRFEFGVS
ncbi:unnamed protein product [Dicrocoelium dendriticum]|nr:unnamed protein product [Dicrocoelium dendriticum]